MYASRLSLLLKYNVGMTVFIFTLSLFSAAGKCRLENTTACPTKVQVDIIFNHYGPTVFLSPIIYLDELSQSSLPIVCPRYNSNSVNWQRNLTSNEAMIEIKQPAGEQYLGNLTMKKNDVGNNEQ